MKIPGSYSIHHDFSIKNPSKFWEFQSEQISWFDAPTEVYSELAKGVSPWFAGGKLNMCYLAVDQHVKTGRGNQTALVYDSPMADASQSYSFAELLDEVSRLAGAMRSLGVKQGDTVVIYMPAVPEAVFAMLACARIGAIHSVVFGGFAAHELALRINDAKPSLIVSASAGFEGTRILEYKPLLDAAVQESIYKPKSVLVLQRKPVEAALVDGRDFDYRSLVTNAEPVDCVWVDASDPLYVLYTSGTTGKPKGIVRDTGGYAVALKYSMTNVFDMKPGQVFWAASDVGWVVGHSYIVYGPLLHACTTVLYEGKPVKTPDAGAFARIIEAYKVNVLLTAPTALRAIRKDDPLGLGSRKYDMSSLNYVFVAGERCDVATYHWAKGLFKKPVIDHWWQTESGWPMVSNMPGLDVMPTKEGSVTQAVCGFDVRIVDETGCELLPNQEGLVVVKLPLPPGFSQKLWGDGDSFKDLYLSQFPGYYTTGDGGYIDEDGYVYISGRTDDVINVAGHRLSTSEMEEIIASHKAISECAVFGIHDELKGQLPIALAVAKDGFVLLESDLEAELAALIRNQIGAVAVFKTMVLVSRLPKTRSGKIMRKTMRKIADGEHYQVPTTIEDPSVLSEIRTAFKRRKIGAAFEKSVTVSNRIRTREDYDKAYQLSVDNPDQFWGDLASQFTWRQKWDKVCEGDFSQAQVKWFTGGKLNITENMLDRHLETRGNKLAIIWEPNDPKERFVRFTYREVYQEVNKFANVLKNNGVKKGDRVAIYMPMIPELAFAVMACARIGAVHSVVFAGFSASALADRINDATAVAVITSDGIFRGAKQIPAKAVVDEALENCYSIRKVIVVERTGWMVNMVEGRDVWYHHEITKVSDQCPAEVMDAEDPLFILYTSGSTGKPKGIQHTVAGYMLYADYTFRNVFQGEESDVFWCTADVGWVTGHSYIVYGPLLAGATTVMFEGIPTYPDPGRFWQVCDKFGVNQFYTAPTAIRSLMALGDDHVYPYNLHSIKTLGSVGEPINEEAWRWYYIHVGKERAPIVDTWWQTETGGIMISALSGITPSKPAHAGLPLPGIQPVLLDQEGKELQGNSVEGYLAIKHPWPGILRTIYGDHERCVSTYFSVYNGYYFTGDGAKRDEDGLYRIIGRVDDVLNVSGHRFGTAEIESAINQHENVVESAVVGYPHDIKGQGIFAYVVCRAEGNIHQNDTEWLRAEVIEAVIKGIGRVARPDKILIVRGLPKTRSGKIMRRILRKIAEGDTANLGDTSTLLDPEIVEEIKQLAAKLTAVK